MGKYRGPGLNAWYENTQGCVIGMIVVLILALITGGIHLRIGESPSQQPLDGFIHGTNVMMAAQQGIFAIPHDQLKKWLESHSDYEIISIAEVTETGCKCCDTGFIMVVRVPVKEEECRAKAPNDEEEADSQDEVRRRDNQAAGDGEGGRQKRHQ